MNTNPHDTVRICQACCTPLPPDAPAGLCPRCLMDGLKGCGTPADAADVRPESVMPVPGRVFGGYLIERVLGQGGMGQVFQAVQIATGRRVALKVMLQTLASEKDRQRFFREGRMAASVNHPNVVYVHSSEEIEGIPVIAMELVHGGTLNDRLNSGEPLSPSDAVAITLELISGLNAAHAVGVLHRDIKPANCFITEDGTLKVGDFGLAISSRPDAGSHLTAMGLAVGTPAYASPEQLRGEELDAASDIYSVGATLYHLLTGSHPFNTHDSINLIAEVLGKEPSPPHILNMAVPVGLSRVVTRCLSKNRRERFQNYRDLHDALLPFSEVRPVPAPLSRRLLAGFLDYLVASAPAVAFMIFSDFDPLEKLHQEGTAFAALSWIACILWRFLYFAVPEGLWGGALGKSLCGLRLVGASQQAPGLARSMLRCTLFLSPYWITAIGTLLFVSPLLDALSFAIGPLLFVTMRRRNGFAAVHDWLSGTRVIVRPKTQSRPHWGQWENNRIHSPLSATTGVSDSGLIAPPAKLGPYDVLRPLWRRGDEELLLGFDSVLQRHLWIHVRSVDAGSVSALRHDLSRPARLRWLNCGVSQIGCWDAYEAVEGVPLLNCSSPLPWNAVRFWLLDLAGEILAAGRTPFTLPTLSFDRIWLSRNGHAFLLDFPCPGLSESFSAMDEFAPRSLSDAQRFLDAVARRALEGLLSGPQLVQDCSRPARVRVPLHARPFLSNLARGSFERMEIIAGNLQHLVSMPADISRAWRASSLALLPACLLGILAITMFTVYFQNYRNERALSELFPRQPAAQQAARVYLAAVQSKKIGETTARDVGLARTNLVAKLQPFLPTNAAALMPKFDAMLDEKEESQRLRQCLEHIETPLPEIVREAESTVVNAMLQKLKSEVSYALVLLGILPLVCIPLAGLVDALVCLFFGFNPFLRLFGIVAVNRLGEPASRLRLLLRSSITWVFFMSVSLLFAILLNLALRFPTIISHHPWLDSARSQSLVWMSIFLLGLFIAAITVYSVRHPSRSLTDRIVGTWLVPE